MSGGLGRLQSVDDRDRQYPMRALLDATAPLPRSTYCYVPRNTFPLDQGDFPHCVGYATRGLLYAGPQVNMGRPDAVTIYHQAQLRDEWPGENYAGTSARGAMKYLHEQGLISTYVWAWDVDTIRLWHLSQRRPSLLGVNWYSSFGQPDKSGFIWITPTAWVRGGHEVLILGWDDRRGAARCMNSWGMSYGDKGRFWIAGEMLDRLMREDGDCVTPVEVKR